MWKGELEVDNLEGVVDTLFNEIKPLYTELYAFVRGRLAEWDDSGTIKPDKPMPAHVLGKLDDFVVIHVNHVKIKSTVSGNMWAQSWETLLPRLLANTSHGDKLSQSNVIPKKWASMKDMARLSENFFTSLGFARLPASFWTKSQFTRPTDGRQAVCHASATNFFKNRDVRYI